MAGDQIRSSGDDRLPSANPEFRESEGMVVMELVYLFTAISSRPFLALNIVKGGDCEMELKDLPGVHALPILRITNQSYFIDLLLKQFRDVDNAYNFIDFNSDDGRVLCEYAKIVSCRCGVFAIVARPEEGKVYCSCCLHKLE
jgi:hypothetical protein